MNVVDFHIKQLIDYSIREQAEKLKGSRRS